MMHAAQALNNTIMNQHIRQANFEVEFFPKAIKAIEDEIRDAVFKGNTAVVITFDDIRDKINFKPSLATWSKENEQTIINEVRKSGYTVEDPFDWGWRGGMIKISWNEVRIKV